jgi:hypothetical protein
MTAVQRSLARGGHQKEHYVTNLEGDAAVATVRVYCLYGTDIL